MKTRLHQDSNTSSTPAAQRMERPSKGNLAGTTRNPLEDRFQESPRMAAQQKAIQRLASPEEEPAQTKRLPLQCTSDKEEEPLQGKASPMQRATGVPINDDPALEQEADRMGAQAMQAKAGSEQQDSPDTAARASSPGGLPAPLKAGVEQLSGMTMDHVQVHYNSSKPSQLQALAYAQGSEIHVAPGQERHLPHEAWHIVQQAQGRVQPSRQQISNDPMVQRKEVVNTDVPMEPEAQGATHWKLVDTAEKGKGDEVHDSIGVNGLFAGPWVNIQGGGAINMWRAHGVARRFGGSGMGDNVGWWPEVVENQWTQEEWKVAGVSDENHTLSEDYAVGQGEQGTYHVARELVPPGVVLTAYQQPILNAIQWGYHNERDAWNRTVVDHVDCIANTVDRGENLRSLQEERDNRKQADIASVTTWFTNHFQAAADLVINRMTLQYTETQAGINQNPAAAIGTKDVKNKVVFHRQWDERPKNKPKQARNVKAAGVNANVANLRINSDPPTIWAALAAGQAIVAHGGRPALALTAPGSVQVFKSNGKYATFRPSRLPDGFGSPL